MWLPHTTRTHAPTHARTPARKRPLPSTSLTLHSAAMNDGRKARKLTSSTMWQHASPIEGGIALDQPQNLTNPKEGSLVPRNREDTCYCARRRATATSWSAEKFLLFCWRRFGVYTAQQGWTPPIRGTVTGEREHITFGRDKRSQSQGKCWSDLRNGQAVQCSEQRIVACWWWLASTS